MHIFQKLLGNKHLRLRDSRLSLARPSGDLGLSTRKKNKKLFRAYNRVFRKNDKAG